jgi:hypothetical protein
VSKVLKQLRRTPPRCVRGLACEPTAAPERGARPDASAFRLACRCRGKKGRVLGYSLAEYNREYDGPVQFIGPLGFACVKCRERTRIIDTDIHGWHGELDSSAVMRGSGRREAYRCPKCDGDEFGVTVTFQYPDEALWADDDDLPAAREDSFNGFQLHGTCAGCKKVSWIAGFEL